MAKIAETKLTSKGVSPTYVAASAGGDNFDFDEELVLHVKHTDPAAAGNVTVTLTSQVGADAPAGLVAQNLSLTLAPGEDEFVDMARAQNLRDSSGLVQISASDATKIKYAVLRKA